MISCYSANKCKKVGESVGATEVVPHFVHLGAHILHCFHPQGSIHVFKGASSISLDAKGRLSVPTRHRDVLMATAGGKLTLTKSPDGCLLLYPLPEWERFAERVQQLGMEAQWWKRLFLGNAMDVELDGTGRVLVSPELRQFAGITKDVVLLGMGTYFELWDKAQHDAKEAAAIQGPVPDSVKHLVL